MAGASTDFVGDDGVGLLLKFSAGLEAFTKGNGASLVDLCAEAVVALDALVVTNNHSADRTWWTPLLHADVGATVDHFLKQQVDAQSRLGDVGATVDHSEQHVAGQSRLVAFKNAVLGKCSGALPCSGPRPLFAVSALQAAGSGQHDADIQRMTPLLGAHMYDEVLHTILEKAPSPEMLSSLLSMTLLSDNIPEVLAAKIGPAAVDRLKTPRSMCALSCALHFAECERVSSNRLGELSRLPSRVFWSPDPTTTDDAVFFRSGGGAWHGVGAPSESPTDAPATVFAEFPLTYSNYDLSDPEDLRLLLVTLFVRQLACDVQPLLGMRGRTETAPAVHLFRLLADLTCPIVITNRRAGRPLGAWLAVLLAQVEVSGWGDTRAVYTVCRNVCSVLQIAENTRELSVKETVLAAERALVDAQDTTCVLILHSRAPVGMLPPRLDWRSRAKDLGACQSAPSPVLGIVATAKELCDVIDARECVRNWSAASAGGADVTKVVEDLKFALFPGLDPLPRSFPGRLFTVDSGELVERQLGDARYIIANEKLLSAILTQSSIEFPYLATLLQGAKELSTGCLREPQVVQRVFVCLSCSTHMSAICSSCAFSCHAAFGHCLVDVGQRRDFGCDCGSPRMVSGCGLVPLELQDAEEARASLATTPPLLFSSNFAIPPRICYEQDEEGEATGCSFHNVWGTNEEHGDDGSGAAWSSATQLQCMSCQNLCHLAPCTYDSQEEVATALAAPDGFVCNVCFDDEQDARDMFSYERGQQEEPPLQEQPRQDGAISAGKAEEE
jgi:hypothetical protein